MLRLMESFWPVLMPLFSYVGWYLHHRKQRLAAGEAVISFLAGPLWMAIIASLAIAIILFLWLGLSAPADKGEYHRTHMEDGKVVRGGVTP